MNAIKIRFLVVLSLSMTMFTGQGYSQELNSDQPAAQKAALDILHNFAAGQFKLVWDQETSSFAKTHYWAENDFLANMSMSRPALGQMESSYFITAAFTTSDPQTGFQGDLYAITFRDKYSAGEFYERVVVIKDSDGIYRLAGLYGSPVPPGTPPPGQ